MAEQFANNAQSVLASVCAILDTSITVQSAASFPATGDFRLLVDNELMLCTSVAGVVFSVTRAIEGTTAAAHSLGAAVILPLTAGSLATLGGGGGGPTGPAGGVLDGTYPNPDFAFPIDAGNDQIINVADPVGLQDAVTQATLNNNAVGLMAVTVGAATTAALPACTYANGSSGVGATLTGNANGLLTVDSLAMGSNGRIIVKDQAAALQNGLYTVTQAGDGSHPFILTRTQDMQYSNEFSRRLIFVVNGTVNVGSAWVCTTDTPVIGTDPVAFAFFAFPDRGDLSVRPLSAYDATTDFQYTKSPSLSFGTVITP